MKIIHAVHCFPPEHIGGAERVTLRLVKALHRLGHEVVVFSGSLDWEKGFRVEEYDYQGIPVIKVHRDDPWFDRWDNGYHPGVEALWRKVLKKEKPDIVHVDHWIRLTRNLVQSAREEGIKSVVHLHDFHSTCPRTFRTREDERDFCECVPDPLQCLDCVKKWPFQGKREVLFGLRHYLRDFLNELRSANARLAPSGFHAGAVKKFLKDECGDIDIFPPPAERELKRRAGAVREDGMFRIAHWGNLYDLKGTSLLLDAIRAAGRETRIKAIVLGRATKESFRRELEEKAEGLDVEFSGEYKPEDLEGIDAHVAVFPSLCPESYGLVVDEAFMLGIPVIVTDIGAPRERTGDAGILVKPGDVEGLKNAILMLARDRELLGRMRRSIRKTWKLAGESGIELENLYKEILEGKRPSLEPLRPLGHFQRLFYYWFVSSARLASLGGSGIDHPPPWRE